MTFAPFGTSSIFCRAARAIGPPSPFTHEARPGKTRASAMVEDSVVYHAYSTYAHGLGGLWWRRHDGYNKG